jgi:hypothetical protein
LDLLLNLNEILNLLVCIGALILVLRWKDLSPKRYWWIAVGIAVALSIITNPSLHTDPKILFEVPESLNKIANFAANTIAFFIIPLTLIVRVFQLESLWLKLLSILIFIIYVFFCWIGLIALSLAETKTIDKFDAQDGYVYLLKDRFIPGFSDSETCVSVRQYQRILPGILNHRTSFAPQKTKRDIPSSYSDEVWKCSTNYNYGSKAWIEQIRQRFPDKSLK